MKCSVCGGTTRVIGLNGRWVACPKCCSAVSEAKKVTNTELDSANKSSILDDLKIPSIYQRTRYDSSIVFYNRKASLRYSAETLKNTATICDAIYHKLYSVDLFMQSVYIHFPPEIDGNLWVYNLQKIAVERGISTLPYITLNDLDDKVTKEDRSEFNEYKSTKLCILDASARTMPDAWVTLADLLFIRARNELPTIVTGYWSSATLSKRDNGGAKYLFDDTAEWLSLLKPYDLLSKNSRATVYKREQPNVDNEYYNLLGIGDGDNAINSSEN